MTTPRNPRTISWRSLVSVMTATIWAVDRAVGKDSREGQQVRAARRLSREAVRLARLGLEWKAVAEEQHEIVRAYRARDRARAELYALAARDSFGLDALRRATESLEAARATLTKHGEPHP